MAGRLLPAGAPHPSQGHCPQPAGMQSSGCAGAVGPASDPAPLGAAWDGRGDAGAVAGAGGERKGDVSTELCPERAQVGVLGSLRPCSDAAPPRWAQHPAAPQTEAAPTRRFRGHVGRPCPLTVTPGGSPLGRGAHSQRKRTYQTVSFFSCGPNSGLACARMAISQLRTDGGCEARGWEGKQEGREGGREGRLQAGYSQEVAAHGGGDQHGDDHPAETAGSGRAARPRSPRFPPRPPHSPAVGPLGHEPGGGDAHEPPEGGEEDERQREAVRSHGLPAPLRSPHGNQSARGAPRPRRLPLDETRGEAPPLSHCAAASMGGPRPQWGGARPQWGPAARASRPSSRQTPSRLGDSSSFMARSPTSGPAVAVVVVMVVVVVAVHPGPRGHLGSLRSSAMSHSATLSSAREPDWCVAASGVGT